MKSTTLLLALAALAATSCSLQLDSQYGLRWDRRVPAQRHNETESERTETIAAATTVTDEFHTTTDWSEANYAQIDEAQSADQIQLTTDRPEPGYEAFTEEQTTMAQGQASSEDHISPTLEDRGPDPKEVLSKFFGTLVMMLGVLFLLITYFAILVMAAYGANFYSVLITILIFSLGILLIILGRRLYRRYLTQ